MNKNKGRRDNVGGKLQVYPQYKRVCFHLQRHADEVLAHMMLFTRAGREVFPNLNPEDIVYTSDNNRDYRDHPDTLHIGCGGDPRFDEHTLKNDKWNSACTLMAKALGLDTHPAWRKTIENVRREDREGKAIQGEIAWVLKAMYRCHGGNTDADEEVALCAEIAYGAEIDSAMEKRSMSDKPLTTKTAVTLLEKQNHPKLEWFKEMYREALRFEEITREHAKKHFLEQSKCYTFTHSELGLLKLFTITSDNEGMASICWGFGADIVVIRKTNGHTAILTNYNRGRKNEENNLIILSAVLKELNLREKVSGADWVGVGQECTLLLNGSKTHPDVRPSGLSLNQIANIIRSTLGSNGFKHDALSYRELEAELKSCCGG